VTLVAACIVRRPTFMRVGWEDRRVGFFVLRGYTSLRARLVGWLSPNYDILKMMGMHVGCGNNDLRRGWWTGREMGMRC
jgi:hypothetical protein